MIFQQWYICAISFQDLMSFSRVNNFRAKPISGKKFLFFFSPMLCFKTMWKCHKRNDKTNFVTCVCLCGAFGFTVAVGFEFYAVCLSALLKGPDFPSNQPLFPFVTPILLLSLLAAFKWPKKTQTNTLFSSLAHRFFCWRAVAGICIRLSAVRKVPRERFS